MVGKIVQNQALGDLWAGNHSVPKPKEKGSKKEFKENNINKNKTETVPENATPKDEHPPLYYPYYRHYPRGIMRIKDPLKNHC